MKNDFNRVAYAYDFIARIIFGANLHKSQIIFFNQIMVGDKILILGGGTGRVLFALEKLKKDLNVVYVDLSANMIKSAQRRGPFNHLNVEFVQGSYDRITTDKFDVIMTHFFLDIFDSQNLPSVMHKVESYLKVDGLWFCTDFVKTQSFWKRTLLKIMHRFFQITANLESKGLQNFEQAFKSLGFNKVLRKYFYHNMIEASIYRKPKGT